MDSESVNGKKRKLAVVIGTLAGVVGSLTTIIAGMQTISREPYINHDFERKKYLDSIINGSDQRCHNLLRMNKVSFHRLVALCKEHNLLKDTRNVKVEEQVAEFLHTIGHNHKNRVIHHNFHRSGETISRYFHIVLNAILGLHKVLMKQPTDETETPPRIRYSEMYWPWFKDCVGAIDGTHVRVKVPQSISNRFRGRKDKPTQNILAAVSFDLKFTYVLAGWEGSAHDARVLNDAITRPSGLKVPEADCAKFGEKHGKTFRKSTFTKAATAVSEQFNEVCTTTNVESRMKTVKKRYSNIKLLREKSGWSWDDELKMIVVEKSQALEFIEDNKYAKDLLNVPLEQYEELKLVCGDDQATGSYGKSFSDMPNDEDVGVEETSETHELSTGPTSDSSVPKGGRGKRSRPWEDAFSKIDALSVQISRLTDAFVSSDQNFCDQVFGEVMKTEGFDEDILTKAFEYLTENPLKGRQFIAKRPNMRKDWMKTFATNS